MAKIKFMTDSASDISAADEKELGIYVFPFPITFQDKTYLSRVEINTQQAYDMLESCAQIPTTSQITVYQYTEQFEHFYGEGYSDIINTTINSEGSGTYNSACLAAQMFYETHPGADRVFRIHNLDSASYSCGYGHAVVTGAKMARNGASVDEILSFMRDWIAHSVVFFAPYTLKFAAKSGRIPSAAAFVGELVGLKPIMRIADHAIVTDDKVRGEKKIIPTIRNKTLKEMEPGSEYVLVYGDHDEDREAMVDAMTNAVGYPPAGCYQVGVVVAANAGPHVIGVGFRAKDKSSEV